MTTLSANLSLFDAATQALLQALAEKLGQAHLFAAWPAPGERDDDKKRFAQQLLDADAHYPGGLEAYISNARVLLAQSASGVNPLDGWTPSVPEGECPKFGTAQFDELEAIGLEEIAAAGFVLVAGGLGERLGYSGIKVALPVEISSGTLYLQSYIEHILAFQSHARAASGNATLTLPLAIMTSGDTHDATVALLAAHADFGMAEGQITLLKQEKVPVLTDNDARLGVSSDDAFELETKPHGHGDVHSLMFAKGVSERWVAEQGVRWVVFFQDTNGLVFRGIPAVLGVSKRRGFAVNSLAVPRKPGEPVGSICRLRSADGASDVTLNVEYNQFDPLLRATTSPEGDVAAPDSAEGYSPFPGNVNVLVFEAAAYAAALARSSGTMPEFVNPKYADAAKTAFVKPTRLECMMQEFPKLLDAEASARTGFTQLERNVCFSAVKNDVAGGLDKFKKTGFAESAMSGEADAYLANRMLLSRVKGVRVEVAPEGLKEEYAGVPTQEGAHVVLRPDFGLSGAEIAKRFTDDADVQISNRSTLILDCGPNVRISKLHLDGCLVIRGPTAPDAPLVEIKALSVSNAGWRFEKLDHADASIDEKYRIRGYRLDATEAREIDVRDTAEPVVVDEAAA